MNLEKIKNVDKKTKIIPLLLGVTILSFMVGAIIFAQVWTEPTVVPPGGNVPTPLNVGPVGQAKIGGLILNTGGAGTGLVVQHGNVGIGTAAPVARLEVVGDILVPNANHFMARNAAGVAETWMWPRWSDNVMYTNFGAGGWNIRNRDSANVMFMTHAGNVGIGTTGPGARLDVSGSGGATSCCPPVAPTISLAEASNTAGRRAWLQFHNSGEAEAYIRLAGGGPVGSGREGFRRLEIGDSQGINTGLTVQGNVGIGTTAPGARLHVIPPTAGGIAANMGGGRIQNVASPVEASDVATMGFVEASATAAVYKTECWTVASARWNAPPLCSPTACASGFTDRGVYVVNHTTISNNGCSGSIYDIDRGWNETWHCTIGQVRRVCSRP